MPFDLSSKYERRDSDNKIGSQGDGVKLDLMCVSVYKLTVYAEALIGESHFPNSFRVFVMYFQWKNVVPITQFT